MDSISNLLLTHIVAGAMAIVAGTLAVVFQKGFANHRAAGKVFVGTMLLMALSAGAYAIHIEQPINIVAALLTGYLVLSSWHAARYRASFRERTMAALMVSALVATSLALWLSNSAARAPEGMLGGFHYGDYLFLSCLCGLGIVLDVSVWVRGTLSAPSRTLRHLWRMLLALFIAVGSLFTGPGAAVFPDALKDSGVLALPELIVLALLVYWSITTYRQRGKPAATD